MNISVCTRNSLIVLTTIGAISLPFSALAAEDTLSSWIAQSKVLVDRHMSYPLLALRRDQVGDSYVSVTIDENGRILNYTITGKSGSNLLDRASLKTVKKIKQFPSIPVSYIGEEMTFGIKLKYDIAYTAADFNKKLKGTKVTVQNMSTVSYSPLSSEIVILAENN